ncbi:MAG: hypothetical protein WA705_02710 [Candidatus Ozemobacteraceae bacterium]
MAPEATPKKFSELPTLEELKRRESSPNTPTSDSAKNGSSTRTKSSTGEETVDSTDSDPLDNPTSSENDLRDLQDMDWIGATLKRFRFGKHPDPRIESLLARRLDVKRKEYLAPYPVRLLVSMALIFAVCTTVWMCIWAIGSLFELKDFLLELSSLMIFLLITLFGIAVTNPVNLYDEPSIEMAGKRLLEELQQEVEGTRNQTKAEEEPSEAHSTNSRRSAPSSESKKP